LKKITSYRIGEKAHHVHYGSCIIVNVDEINMFLTVLVASSNNIITSSMAKFHSNF